MSEPARWKEFAIQLAEGATARWRACARVSLRPVEFLVETKLCSCGISSLCRPHMALINCKRRKKSGDYAGRLASSERHMLASYIVRREQRCRRFGASVVVY